MTTEGSPIQDRGETAPSIKSQFDNGNIYLLTFMSNDQNSRRQEIGYINDKVKKISKTYFIVRERNKQNDKFHFHCIFKAIKKPGRAFFQKGCHVDVRKVGERELKCRFNLEAEILPYCFSTQEIEDQIAHGVFTRSHYHQQLEKKRVHDILSRHMARKTHIDKTYAYITKELMKPRQYENYILSIRGKMKELCEAPYH